jgi:hypothetical protein
MTIDLHNGLSAFHLTRNDWNKLLELGQRYGWQPAGTEPPPWDEPDMRAAYADRNGVYTSVNNVDARALAAALEWALPDVADQILPSEHSPTPATTPLPPLDAFTRVSPPAGFKEARDTPRSADFSAGFSKQRLIEFVAFAKRGHFSIHQA